MRRHTGTRILNLVDHSHKCNYNCGSILVKEQTDSGEKFWTYICPTVHANNIHNRIVAGAQK